MSELQVAKICAYCGAALNEANKTRDHIPPKSFFTVSERRQFQMITVPACRKCNNDCSVKDENATHVLNLCVTQMQRDKLEQMQQYKNTLNQNNRLSSALKNAKEILVQDSVTRLYTFEKLISINKSYVNDAIKVFERIARGLYWRHFKKVLISVKYNVNFLAGFDLFESAKEPLEISQNKLKAILELASLSERVDLLPNVYL
jgi:hypothetical protein